VGNFDTVQNASPNVHPLQRAHSGRRAWEAMEGGLLYTCCLSGALLVGRLALGNRTNVGKYSSLNRTIRHWNLLAAGVLACAPVSWKLLGRLSRNFFTSREALTGAQMKIRKQCEMKETQLIYGEVEDASIANRILYIIQHPAFHWEHYVSDWILSPSWGRTYSVGPTEWSRGRN
jgi:hypothetical protein